LTESRSMPHVPNAMSSAERLSFRAERGIFIVRTDSHRWGACGFLAALGIP
jgi:hypothetical protein